MLAYMRAYSGAQVAGDAHFHGHLLVGHNFLKLGIAGDGKAVANPLRTDVQRAPHRFRPGRLAGVGSQVQALGSGLFVELQKPFCRATALVAADTDSGDVALAQLRRELENSRSRLRAEVADGVEDPQQGHTEVAVPAFAAALHAFKERQKVLAAPQDHTHADVNFGVANVLLAQLLHQAVRYQLVVLRRAQALGDRFEGHQEAVEIAVGIKLTRGLFAQNGAAARDIVTIVFGG